MEDFKNNEGYADPTAYEACSNMNPRTYRPIVYICSPYAGDVDKNVAAAKRYCRFAYESGVIPVAPHLLYPQFMNDADQAEREEAMWMGCVLMSKCAELWVFGDIISRGMDHEISVAQKRNQDIRYFTSDCVGVMP